MWLRRLSLVLALGYLAFSVIYLYVVGFSDPAKAMRVGMIGLVVIAVAMAMRSLGSRKRK